MTSYVILFPADREEDWDRASEAERQVVYDTDAEFVRLLRERGGRVTGGAELASASRAHVVRRDQEGGSVITDGPYAESVEQLSGFYLVTTDDEAGLLEAARVLVRSHPAVEVRAVADG